MERGWTGGIPPLPQNAHSHAAPRPAPGQLPYPEEDSLPVAPRQPHLIHHASNPALSTGRQLASRAPLGRVKQHTRNDSGSSVSSFKGFFAGESKPAPKRHYIWESHAPLQVAQITVNQFETVRRAAAQQPHEPRIQLEFARKLVDASNHLAVRYSDPSTPSTMLADKRTETKNRDTWTALAQKITKKLVSRTNMPEACFFLASHYSSGTMGLDVDNVKAFELYSRAAKADHPEACYRVAVSYELGVGIKADPERAMSWYKRAAPLSDVKSMYKLGMTYLHGGLGQQPNFNEALMWLQRAAEKADAATPHAVHELALIFENARNVYAGVTRDPQRALDYFYKAASLGYSPSQVRLGRALEFGELGCGVDPSKSIEWYNVAAQSGDSDAELGLCGWHWTGADGVLKASETEAFLYAERAAQKQNPRAEYALGYFYHTGIGVPVDLERARSYYMRAHEKKHPHALHRLRELAN